MSTRIYSVDSIDLTLQKSNPPNLQILCKGRVTSSGWSNPQLQPFIYIVPPADGVQEFDAVATPPDSGGIVLPVLTPVTAQTVLSNLDIANYWGPRLPLKGIRCHATSNTKTVNLEEAVPGMPKMREIAAVPSAADTPSYESDIRPLFRLRDVSVMKRISGFDLHSYDDVVEHADRILSRLVDETMPCDGPWPEADITLFRQWIEAGKPA